MSTTKHKAFLSHNSKDKTRVKTIARWLLENGVEIWYDKWDIAPGKPWINELEKGMKECAISPYKPPNRSQQIKSGRYPFLSYSATTHDGARNPGGER
ncbi:MAG: toll/interleukin-1 receptor domain-containing protein [Spirochaetales bacterium]|nr:toll/interleukin-1 receptor domain-containing protein [Spirochaetales bacterium]